MNDNIGCIGPHGMYPFPKDRESCPDCQAIRAERAHGTRARYELHRRLREIPCEPCRDAMRRYFHERQARGLPPFQYGKFPGIGGYTPPESRQWTIRDGAPYGWYRSPSTWVGLGCLALLVGLLTALVCLYTGILP